MKKIPYLKSPSKLSPETSLGPVHLLVNDLDRQLEFYKEILKMRVFERRDGWASLGSESDILLILSQDERAIKKEGATGLYHFAILYPSEEDLARAIHTIFSLHYPNWPTDHGMSKTTYLKDAEGNDIELYVRTLDRADFVDIDGQMKFRYKDGRISDGRDPLDLEELFSKIQGSKKLEELPEGSSIGHLHIYSRALGPMMEFYRDFLGFGEGGEYKAMRMGEVALSEDINHVIAFNDWRGSKAPLHQPGDLGIKNVTINLVSLEELVALENRLEKAGCSYEKKGDSILVRDPANLDLIIRKI